MREKISLSRVAHANAEARISQLSKDVSILTEKISLLRPRIDSTTIVNADTSAERIHDEKVCDRKLYKSAFVYFTTMPCDTMCHIFSFLSIDNVAQLESACKGLQLCIESNLYWFRIYPLFFPLRRQYTCTKEFCFELGSLKWRKEISEYLGNVHMIIKFVRIMKEQRSVPKHRSVQPHRHSKSESGITHPLPLFDSRTVQRTANNVAEPQMIMSRSETLNKDFSSYAHTALQKMMELTAESDNIVNSKLAREGIITVLISLLSNEEGALQSYSCALLANLLCWEERSRPPHLTLSSESTLESWRNRIKRERWLCSHVGMFQELAALGGCKSKGGSSSVHDGMVGLADQIEVCGGVKQLAALLTSPSASINLAGGKARSSGGFKELRMIASVQGVATKQASRALLCLFYPPMCIPAPALPSSASDSSHSAINSSTQTALPASPASGSSSISYDSSVLNLAHPPSALSPSSHSPRRPQLPPIALPSAPPLQGQEQQLLNKNLLITPSIGGLFVSGERATPWQFTYYFKSGSFKDQFTAYMKFLPDGFCSGRGIDSVGPFLFSGKVDADIAGELVLILDSSHVPNARTASAAGWAWYFHKSYLRQISLLDVDLESWAQHKVDHCDNLSSNSGNGEERRPIHVSHTGYWSEGVDLAAVRAASLGLGRLLEQLQGSEGPAEEHDCSEYRQEEVVLPSAAVGILLCIYYYDCP